MDEIIFGRNGVLFHATSVHKILDHLTGKIDIPNESIENFEENIFRRSMYCRNRDIKYRHVIFPDKSSVLKSYFPFENVRTFSDRYRQKYTSEVLDLVDHIPDDSKYFLRTDTHLSFYGMVETTLRIMEDFHDFDVDEARRILVALRGDVYDYRGDLGNKLVPEQLEPHYYISGKYCKRFDNQVGANDGYCVVAFNQSKLRDKSNKRLLVFADSFIERAIPLLSYFYSEILFCRSRYFHDEMVDMFKPDQVITASAERYFSMVRLDEVAPRFNLIYGVRDIAHSTNLEFYKALNAVLNFENLQYKNYMHRFLATGGR